MPILQQWLNSCPTHYFIVNRLLRFRSWSFTWWWVQLGFQNVRIQILIQLFRKVTVRLETSHVVSLCFGFLTGSTVSHVLLWIVLSTGEQTLPCELPWLQGRRILWIGSFYPSRVSVSYLNKWKEQYHCLRLMSGIRWEKYKGIL